MRRTLAALTLSLMGLLSFGTPVLAAYSTTAPTGDTTSPFLYSFSGMSIGENVPAGNVYVKISSNNQTQGSITGNDRYCISSVTAGGTDAPNTGSCTMSGVVGVTYNLGAAWISSSPVCTGITGGGGLSNTAGFSFTILEPPTPPPTSLIPYASGTAMVTTVAHDIWDVFFPNFPLVVGVVVLLVIVIVGGSYLIRVATRFSRGERGDIWYWR